ncbi:MAG: hypothetical protein C0504_02600 [Candidatus Solibacter sp.]|nr:hypothetical protein [Candidatus Solibacter sp.]
MKPFNRNLVISLTLVFLSGLAAGALGYRYYAQKTAVTRPDRPPRGPKDFRKAYTKEMTERLKLSDEQVTRLNTILDETEGRFKEFRDRTRPEMQTIQDSQVAAINAMLTVQQQAEYEKMRQEREERRRKRDAGKGTQEQK